MVRSVVLLHGFTQTGASWRPVVDSLGERYRALTPDIRGHGSASGRRPVDLDGVLGDLAEAVPEHSVLVGYSMGGRLALHLAVARPDLVSALVLIGASPGLADPVERRARRRADEELADWTEHASIEEFAERWAQTPVLAGLVPETAQRAHYDRLRNTPGGLAAALRGLGTGVLPSLWERLGEVSAPVTLVVGERDQKFREIAGRMTGCLSDAELVTVPGSGHAVHLEAPQRVGELIAGAARAARR